MCIELKKVEENFLKGFHKNRFLKPLLDFHLRRRRTYFWATIYSDGW
jgi:hypothetical protein